MTVYLLTVIVICFQLIPLRFVVANTIQKGIPTMAKQYISTAALGYMGTLHAEVDGLRCMLLSNGDMQCPKTHSRIQFNGSVTVAVIPVASPFVCPM